MKLSIAIPYHGDRWRYVEQTLKNLWNDPRVHDVVIVDDASPRELFDKLAGNLLALRPHPFPIHLHRNESNVFVFRNKRRAVRFAEAEWVCLLDSDNMIDPSYLDAWEREHEPVAGFNLTHTTAYLPEFARPAFDYREFSGLTFRKENIAPFMQRPLFDCLLNTMNFVVHRAFFLRALEGVQHEPHTADSIFINWCLVNAGGQLHVTKGMQYEHTVHDGSTWKIHHDKGDAENARLVKAFSEMV